MFDIIFSTVRGDAGFHLFSAGHIAIMITSLILACIVVKINKVSRKFEIGMTIGILFILACLYVWYINSDPEEFIFRGLPLHTCRFGIILLSIGIFFKKDTLIKLGSYWGLFGGSLGMMMPAIDKYAFPHILHITSFAMHIYLLLIAVYMLFVKKIGMNKDDYKMCIKFTSGFLTFTFIINLLLDSHYSYTTRMPLALMKLGFTFPPIVCFVLVIAFYMILGILEYALLNFKNKKKQRV